MEPRQKLNMQGLLRFAVEQTKAEDAPPSNVELDEERKSFLEAAMKSMTVNIMEEFEKAISILDNDASSLQDKLVSLNVIRENIDGIDFANSFVKAGGTKILLKHLDSPNSAIRVSVIYIIGEMSQNNPFCQNHFLGEKIIPVLVSNFNGNEDVSRSAIHAISALIRNFEPGLMEFLRIGGIKTLLSTLNTIYTKVFIKASFLIATLSSENVGVRDDFVEQNTIPLLFTYVEPVNHFDIKIETTLYALSELSKSNYWKPTKDKAGQTMKNLLNDIIVTNENSPENEETVAYAKIIMDNYNAKAG